MKKLFPIISIIGGGSNYTSEVLRLLVELAGTLGLREIRLMDNDRGTFEDTGMTRCQINANLAERMVRAQGASINVSVHYELTSALKGTTLVLAQVRPGMNQERIRLELLGRKYGCIGQETNGIAGMALAVLSINALLEVAHAMEELAPHAPLINFSNPAGMVTQAIVNHSSISAFGMCNIPICFILEALKGAGFEPEAIERTEVGWYGLNHLTFFDRLKVDGKCYMDEARRHFITISEDEWGDLGVVDETLAWMLDHKIIPGHYVPYYLFTRKVTGFQAAQALTRGQKIALEEPLLFRDLMDPELVTTPERLRGRGGTNYSKAAIRAILGLQSEEGVTQVLCCKNGETLPFLPPNVAIEVPTRVTVNGVQTIPQKVNEQVMYPIMVMARLQNLVVEAAVSRDRRTLLDALVWNPTTPWDRPTCSRMLDELFGVGNGLYHQWR